MGHIKVYKDRSNNTWYWQCNVPLCANNAWALGGQPTAMREGLQHLDTHRRMGFGGKRCPR